jgi:bacillolysin
LLSKSTERRFQRFYQGVPIWGSDVVRDSASGITTAIFGVLSPDNLSLSVTPTLSANQGRASLVNSGGVGASLLTEPTLVIVRLPSGEHHLTYSAVVSGDGKIDRVFIDGQTGAEVMRYSEIQTQTQAVGTGTGVLGDQKKLSVQSSGTFFAYDTHRPPAFKGVLAGGRQLSGSDTASDSDNVWTDSAVVDAHVHVSWAYDFMFKRFGRSGLDGRNRPIYVVTNALSESIRRTLGSAWGS